MDNWEPGQSKKFIICNHTNALEVPIVVGLPYLKHTPNLNLSYLGGDIIQRYKLIPLMMHARIVEAVTYSEKKPNFRNFKKDVLYVLERRTIFLFPEGKRTYSEEILPFETGVMKIAYKFQIDLDIFVVGGLMKFSDDTKFIHFRKNNLVYVAFCGKIQASEHASFESYLQCAEKMMKKKKENLDTLYFPN
ncbi:acyltransferase [Leptospira ryugenii]|uniref:Acyltransferase n=1 Tax=Leptospira ryugenii TaxID=1917863 RepID=A0A2P2E2F5_9LEPT|nr:acyltransferase [Leptospira ryugenii]